MHSKNLQHKRQMDLKQYLELEIQQLKVSLSMLKHIEEDEDEEVLKKMNAMERELSERLHELQDMEALNKTLIMKERQMNDELQKARKILINVSVFFQDIYFLSSLFSLQINFVDFL